MHTREEILRCFVEWLSCYACRVDRYTITEETRLTQGKFNSRLESDALIQNGGQVIMFRYYNKLSELSAQVERELLGEQLVPYDRTKYRAHVRFFKVFQTVGQWIDWIEGIERNRQAGPLE